MSSENSELLAVTQRIENKLDSILEKFDRMEKRLGKTETKIEEIKHILIKISSDVDQTQSLQFMQMFAQMFVSHVCEEEDDEEEAPKKEVTNHKKEKTKKTRR